jgi:hypothetical protein
MAEALLLSLRKKYGIRDKLLRPGHCTINRPDVLNERDIDMPDCSFSIPPNSLMISLSSRQSPDLPDWTRSIRSLFISIPFQFTITRRVMDVNS